jgi:hypothetical protein
MDSDNEALPDADAEAPEFTESDWLADVDRYYQDDRPAERRPNEFTINDWRDLMSERRGVHLHRNQASNELEKLRERGIVQRRDAVINGKRGWLYSFVKQYTDAPRAI